MVFFRAETAFLVLWLLQAVSAKITLKNNGYEGIVVAIHPKISEEPELIESIKVALADTSKHLFLATNNRTYIRKVTILIPNTWTSGEYTSASKGESYSKADILVAESNPVYGEFPYTLQYGECGKPGQYIHITPRYLKDQKYEFDYGARGKVITREWAHSRWGVYNEVATEGYEEFYLQLGSVEATRCPSSLRGLNRVIDYSNGGTMDACSLNQSTLMPEPGCVFVPYRTQPEGLNASMMALHYLEPVTGFCHSDPSNPVNQHNTAAPNEHNRLCNLRSTLDVIMDTEDFANGRNSPIPSGTDKPPTFEVVQTSPPRYVLVMDVSRSMTGPRLAVMQRAASLFVTEYVADGSYVGLVSFQSTSYKLSGLQKIDEISRANLDSIIRGTTAKGRTAIGKGIQSGLEVLQGSGRCGGNIVVLTDGEENEEPYVADVYDNVINCSVKIYSVFLDLKIATVNQIMNNISEESGGDWFLANSASSSTDIIDIFRKLSQNDDGDSTKNTQQIHSRAFTVAGNSMENGSVVIDTTVGNDTVFVFTRDGSLLNILLKSPSGCVFSTYFDASLSYCSDDPIHNTTNHMTDAYKFNVPGTAQAGKWMYIVTNLGTEQTITLTVTSRASNVNIPPIEVDVKLALNDITSSVPTVMYAKITQGFSAVLNANVTAIITTPSSTKIHLKLHDNGACPDVRKNDGVYSRYFFSYEGQGRYSVQVKVNGKFVSATETPSGPPAAFNPGVINDNGIFEPNPNGLTNLPTTVALDVTTEDFERVETGGSFSYSGPDNSEDAYGPNRITDLSGKQLNLTDLDAGVFVKIIFTAPGDDLDSGNASSYEIRYTSENATFLLDHFNESILVDQDEVVGCNLSSPLEASNVENCIFKIPNNTNNATEKVFIAVKSYDDVANPSDVSNIWPMTLFFKRSALPTVSEPETDATTPTGSARPIAPFNYQMIIQMLIVYGGFILV